MAFSHEGYTAMTLSRKPSQKAFRYKNEIVDRKCLDRQIGEKYDHWSGVRRAHSLSASTNRKYSKRGGSNHFSETHNLHCDAVGGL